MEKEEEINQLLDALEGNTSEEETTDGLQGEEEKEEVEASDDNEEEESSNENQLETEETAEESEESDKEETTSSSDDKDATIEALRKQIEELSKPKVEEKTEPVKEEEVTVSEQDFVKDVDVDSLVNDPKELNSLLNKVYAQATKDVMKMVSEANAKAVPDAVMKRLEEVSKLKAMHDQFYEANPQLVNFKKVVATVFNEIQADNKGKSYDDLLKLTADDTYKRLGLKKEPVKKAPLKAVPKLPSKSKGGSRPGPTAEKKGLQSEIEDLIKSQGA